MRHVLKACAPFALAACSLLSLAQSENAPATPPPIPAGAYTLDKAHASLIFRVNHLGFSNFTGRFTRFDANLQFDPANPTASRVQVTIDPASIDFDSPPAGFLDELRGAKWLNTAQFPQMTFRSTAIDVTAPNTMRIKGELSLHGVTRPVTLDAKYNGGYAGHPMDPHARIGFSAHGSFKRSEFGIANGVPAPGTTMGVSDNVDVIIEAEFNGPALAAATPAQG